MPKYTCDRPTFIGARSGDQMYADGEPLSTEAMYREQDRTLNPDLVRCGRLPGCEDCGLPFVDQVTPGDALRVVARRAAVRLDEADLV